MGFLEERNLSDVPSIPEYYQGKTIFITGGSGFMGQALVEKLLYSCSELDRIYLLLRSKKGVKSEDRLEALYTSSCFDRLRQEKPRVFKSKVFGIAGDVAEIGLGLSDEDRTLLVKSVNIIFHVAASVRFDDTLQYSARMNVRGTREIVELAKEVKNLSAMVHVSTCYINTNYDYIEEVIYPAHADWRDTLHICDVTDEHCLRVLTPKYLGGMPNTYVFTKQLAEHVVNEQKGKLPVVIIRPSIVLASEKEPQPGWINNFNGPVGIFAAGGKGLLRSLYCNPDLECNHVPVDACIRNFITAGWIRGTKRLEETDDVEIYNCSAHNLIKIIFKELFYDYGKKLVEEIPPRQMLWLPNLELTTSVTVAYIKTLLLHLLPAILIDSILWLLGKKPLLVKIQRRIYIASLAVRVYLTQQWIFDNKNFVLLRTRIKKQDVEQFYYDLEGLDKIGYIKNSFLGGMKYLLKEDISDFSKNIENYKRMKMLDRAVKVLFYGFICWWVFNTRFVQEYLSAVSVMLS